MIQTSELLATFRIPEDNQTEVAYITALEEAAAVAYVERETNRSFTSPAAETTEYIIGDGGVKLFLAETPTAIPDTVAERSSPGADATTITASADDGYLLRGATLVRKNGLVWTRAMEYTVTYTAGYAAGAEPADIRHAVRVIVTHWFERRVPWPKPGENFAEPVPHHLDAILKAWYRRPW